MGLVKGDQSLNHLALLQLTSKTNQTPMEAPQGLDMLVATAPDGRREGVVSSLEMGDKWSQVV